MVFIINKIQKSHLLKKISKMICDKIEISFHPKRDEIYFIDWNGKEFFKIYALFVQKSEKNERAMVNRKYFLDLLKNIKKNDLFFFLDNKNNLYVYEEVAYEQI